MLEMGKCRDEADNKRKFRLEDELQKLETVMGAFKHMDVKDIYTTDNLRL